MAELHSPIKYAAVGAAGDISMSHSPKARLKSLETIVRIYFIEFHCEPQ